MRIQKTPFGKNPFKRGVAILTVALFLSMDLLNYVPSSFAQIANVQGGNPSQDLSRLVRDAEIRIPPELGKIDEVYFARDGGDRMADGAKQQTKGSTPSTIVHPLSSKTIVFLQDAHDSLEAQENIAKIINHLVANYGVKTVFEEGYEGPVPTDKYFGSIKDLKIREKVSYFLMDRLRIGGAEYAHINRKRSEGGGRREEGAESVFTPSAIHHPSSDFNLIGADSLKLHKANIDQYRFSAAKKDAITKDLKALERELKSLADSRFPKELKEWFKAKAQFDAKKLDLFTYLGRTIPLADSVEGGADREKLNAKRSTLHADGLLRFILEAVRSNDPVVIEKAKHIDAREVFDELTKLEQTVAETYLKNDSDKTLFSYYKILGLLDRLNDLQVSQEEYEAVKTSLETFDTSSFARFIFNQSPKTLILSRMWEQNIKDAIKFYEIAQQRDLSLGQALDKYLGAETTDYRPQTIDQKPPHLSSPQGRGIEGEGKSLQSPKIRTDVAVLVFGGFHKEAIKRTLEAKNISYLVVSPRITKPSLRHEQFYKKLMSEGRFSYELLPTLRVATRAESRIEIWDRNPALAVTELGIMASVARDMPSADSRSLGLAVEKALETSASQGAIRLEMRATSEKEASLASESKRAADDQQKQLKGALTSAANGAEPRLSEKGQKKDVRGMLEFKPASQFTEGELFEKGVAAVVAEAQKEKGFWKGWIPEFWSGRGADALVVLRAGAAMGVWACGEVTAGFIQDNGLYVFSKARGEGLGNILRWAMITFLRNSGHDWFRIGAPEPYNWIPKDPGVQKFHEEMAGWIGVTASRDIYRQLEYLLVHLPSVPGEMGADLNKEITGDEKTGDSHLPGDSHRSEARQTDVRPMTEAEAVSFVREQYRRASTDAARFQGPSQAVELLGLSSLSKDRRLLMALGVAPDFSEKTQDPLRVAHMDLLAGTPYAHQRSQYDDEAYPHDWTYITFEFAKGRLSGVMIAPPAIKNFPEGMTDALAAFKGIDKRTLSAEVRKAGSPYEIGVWDELVVTARVIHEALRAEMGAAADHVRLQAEASYFNDHPPETLKGLADQKASFDAIVETTKTDDSHSGGGTQSSSEMRDLDSSYGANGYVSRAPDLISAVSAEMVDLGESSPILSWWKSQLAELARKKGERLGVLSVGFGFGNLEFALAQEGYDVLGVDAFKPHVDQAQQKTLESWGETVRKKGGSLSFQFGDAEQLANVPDHSVRVAIFSEMIGHFNARKGDDWQLRNVFEKIHSKLEPGGTVIITNYLTKKTASGMRADGRWVEYTDEDIQAALEQAGFQHVVHELIKADKFIHDEAHLRGFIATAGEPHAKISGGRNSEIRANDSEVENPSTEGFEAPGKYKVVFFDIGNVLLRGERAKTSQALMKYCDKSESEISAAMESGTSKDKLLYEKGLLSNEEFFRKIKDKLGLSMDYETFERAYTEKFTPIEENVKILRQLKAAGYKIGVISEIGRMSKDYVRSKYADIFGMADWFLASCDLGMMKDDPAIFDKALEVSGFPSGEAVFVDDLEKNVGVAATRGITGVQFVPGQTDLFASLKNILSQPRSEARILEQIPAEAFDYMKQVARLRSGEAVPDQKFTIRDGNNEVTFNVSWSIFEYSEQGTEIYEMKVFSVGLDKYEDGFSVIYSFNEKDGTLLFADEVGADFSRTPIRGIFKALQVLAFRKVPFIITSVMNPETKQLVRSFVGPTGTVSSLAHSQWALTHLGRTRPEEFLSYFSGPPVMLSLKDREKAAGGWVSMNFNQFGSQAASLQDLFRQAKEIEMAYYSDPGKVNIAPERQATLRAKYPAEKVLALSDQFLEIEKTPPTDAGPHRKILLDALANQGRRLREIVQLSSRSDFVNRAEVREGDEARVADAKETVKYLEEYGQSTSSFSEKIRGVFAHTFDNWRDQSVFRFPVTRAEHPVLFAICMGGLGFCAAVAIFVGVFFPYLGVLIPIVFPIGFLIILFWSLPHVTEMNDALMVVRNAQQFQKDNQLVFDVRLKWIAEKFEKETGWNVVWIRDSYTLAKADQTSRTVYLSIGWVLKSERAKDDRRLAYLTDVLRKIERAIWGLSRSGGDARAEVEDAQQENDAVPAISKGDHLPTNPVSFLQDISNESFGIHQGWQAPRSEMRAPTLRGEGPGGDKKSWKREKISEALQKRKKKTGTMSKWDFLDSLKGQISGLPEAVMDQLRATQDIGQWRRILREAGVEYVDAIAGKFLQDAVKTLLEKRSARAAKLIVSNHLRRGENGRHLVCYLNEDFDYIIKTYYDPDTKHYVRTHWLEAFDYYVRPRLRNLAVPTFVVDAVDQKQKLFTYIREDGSRQSTDIAIVQRKVTPLLEYLKRLVRNGETEKAKTLIDGFKKTLIAMFRRGVVDADFGALLANYGVDEKTGRIFVFDFGDLTTGIDPAYEMTDFLDGVTNKYTEAGLREHVSDEIADYFKKNKFVEADFKDSVTGSYLFGVDYDPSRPEDFMMTFPYDEAEIRAMFANNSVHRSEARVDEEKPSGVRSAANASSAISEEEASFLDYYKPIKNVVNPDDRDDKVALNVGSGADVKSFVFSTNVTKAYFVDQSPLDVRKFLLALKFHGGSGAGVRGLRSAASTAGVFLYLLAELTSFQGAERSRDRENIAAYEHKKKRLGFGASDSMKMDNIEVKIILELQELGAEIRSEDIAGNKDGSVSLKFRWAYPGRKPREYAVTLISADITKPDRYPQRLKDVLDQGIDIYYQKAGYHMLEKPETFMPLIASRIKPGGFSITDDELYTRKGQFEDVNLNKYLPGFTGRGGMISDELVRAENVVRNFQLRKRDIFHVDYGWHVWIRQKRSDVPAAVVATEATVKTQASQTISSELKFCDKDKAESWSYLALKDHFLESVLSSAVYRRVYPYEDIKYNEVEFIVRELAKNSFDSIVDKVLESDMEPEDFDGRVSLHLTYDEGTLVITSVDNGKPVEFDENGLPIKRTRDWHHFGGGRKAINAIREDLEKLKGVMTYQPLESGTKVEVRIPLKSLPKDLNPDHEKKELSDDMQRGLLAKEYVDYFSAFGEAVRKSVRTKRAEKIAVNLCGGISIFDYLLLMNMPKAYFSGNYSGLSYDALKILEKDGYIRNGEYKRNPLYDGYRHEFGLSLNEMTLMPDVAVSAIAREFALMKVYDVKVTKNKYENPVISFYWKNAQGFGQRYSITFIDAQEVAAFEEWPQQLKDVFRDKVDGVLQKAAWNAPSQYQNPLQERSYMELVADSLVEGGVMVSDDIAMIPKNPGSDVMRYIDAAGDMAGLFQPIKPSIDRKIIDAAYATKKKALRGYHVPYADDYGLRFNLWKPVGSRTGISRRSESRQKEIEKGSFATNFLKIDNLRTSQGSVPVRVSSQHSEIVEWLESLQRQGTIDKKTTIINFDTHPDTAEEVFDELNAGTWVRWIKLKGISEGRVIWVKGPASSPMTRGMRPEELRYGYGSSKKNIFNSVSEMAGKISGPAVVTLDLDFLAPNYEGSVSREKLQARIGEFIQAVFASGIKPVAFHISVSPQHLATLQEYLAPNIELELPEMLGQSFQKEGMAFERTVKRSEARELPVPASDAFIGETYAALRGTREGKWISPFGIPYNLELSSLTGEDDSGKRRVLLAWWLDQVKSVFDAAKKVQPGLTQEKFSILELGSGDGYLARELAEKRYSITGMDFVKKFVNVSKKANPYPRNLRFVRGDATNLDGYGDFKGVPDASFDLVISNEWLGNVPIFEAQARVKGKKEKRRVRPVFHEIFRKLKPGGVYILNDYLEKINRSGVAETRRDPISWWIHYSVADRIRALQKAGFTNVLDAGKVPNGLSNNADDYTHALIATKPFVRSEARDTSEDGMSLVLQEEERGAGKRGSKSIMKAAPNWANTYGLERFISRGWNVLDTAYNLSHELTKRSGEQQILLIGVGRGFAAIEMVLKFPNVIITAVNKEEGLWDDAKIAEHMRRSGYNKKDVAAARERIQLKILDVEDPAARELKLGGQKFDLVVFEPATQFYMRDKVKVIQDMFNERVKAGGIYAFAIDKIFTLPISYSGYNVLDYSGACAIIPEAFKKAANLKKMARYTFPDLEAPGQIMDSDVNEPNPETQYATYEKTGGVNVAIPLELSDIIVSESQFDWLTTPVFISIYGVSADKLAYSAAGKPLIHGAVDTAKAAAKDDSSRSESRDKEQDGGGRMAPANRTGREGGKTDTIHHPPSATLGKAAAVKMELKFSNKDLYYQGLLKSALYERVRPYSDLEFIVREFAKNSFDAILDKVLETGIKPEDYDGRVLIDLKYDENDLVMTSTDNGKPIEFGDDGIPVERERDERYFGHSRRATPTILTYLKKVNGAISYRPFELGTQIEVRIPAQNLPEGFRLENKKTGDSHRFELRVANDQQKQFEGELQNKQRGVQPAPDIFRTTPGVKERLVKVVFFTSLLGAFILPLYFSGGFEWYVKIKTGMIPGSLFFAEAAALDAFTGMIIWATSDMVGQYLNQGRRIRLKQSFILGFFGIFQGLSTHLLFNAIEVMPVLFPWAMAQKILRTGVALSGGLAISLVFARGTSLARRILKVSDYSSKKEWNKAGDVILAKFAFAPLKTFVVINILPPAIRVITEQAWDYLMTMFSAYLMNRKEPVFAGRFSALTSKRTQTGDSHRSEVRDANDQQAELERESDLAVSDSVLTTGRNSSEGPAASKTLFEPTAKKQSDELPGAKTQFFRNANMSEWARQPLSEEEEADLFRQIRDEKGDPEVRAQARMRLVEAYLFFVAGMADDFSGKKLVFEDLLGIGILELHEAIDKYEPSKGRFVGLAGAMVRRAMQTAIAEQGTSNITIPYHARKRCSELKKACEKVGIKNPRAFRGAELRARLKKAGITLSYKKSGNKEAEWTDGVFESTLAAMLTETSLDEDADEIDPGAGSRQSKFDANKNAAVEFQRTPEMSEDELADLKREGVAMLREALRRYLGEKMRGSNKKKDLTVIYLRVLRLKYGRDPMPIEEIAKKVDLTAARVWQIDNKFRKKIEEVRKEKEKGVYKELPALKKEPSKNVPGKVSGLAETGAARAEARNEKTEPFKHPVFAEGLQTPGVNGVQANVSGDVSEAIAAELAGKPLKYVVETAIAHQDGLRSTTAAALLMQNPQSSVGGVLKVAISHEKDITGARASILAVQMPLSMLVRSLRELVIDNKDIEIEDNAVARWIARQSPLLKEELAKALVFVAVNFGIKDQRDRAANVLINYIPKEAARHLVSTMMSENEKENEKAKANEKVNREERAYFERARNLLLRIANMSKANREIVVYDLVMIAARARKAFDYTQHDKKLSELVELARSIDAPYLKSKLREFMKYRNMYPRYSKVLTDILEAVDPDYSFDVPAKSENKSKWKREKRNRILAKDVARAGDKRSINDSEENEEMLPRIDPATIIPEKDTFGTGLEGITQASNEPLQSLAPFFEGIEIENAPGVLLVKSLNRAEMRNMEEIKKFKTNTVSRVEKFIPPVKTPDRASPKLELVVAGSKATAVKPWQVLQLKQDVIMVLEQSRIDALSPEMHMELLKIAGLNHGKLHLVIPGVFQGKYSERVAELRKVASVYDGFPPVAASEKIPVIGFSDMDSDTLEAFQKRIDPRLAKRLKDSAFGLNRAGSFGVGILYALKDIPPDQLRPNENGFRYDRSGWYSSQVLEVLQAYVAISIAA